MPAPSGQAFTCAGGSSWRTRPPRKSGGDQSLQAQRCGVIKAPGSTSTRWQMPPGSVSLTEQSSAPTLVGLHVPSFRMSDLRLSLPAKIAALEILSLARRAGDAGGGHRPEGAKTR
jgi:hypothetical protein